jgi:DNA-binding winged helix-turn-helix (wHTH) protein/tetratricopeptide (TPR) repeat protein
MDPGHCVCVGDFQLNRRTGELRRNGMLVRIPPQPFEILLILVAQPGELVTRDAIREVLWRSNTFVDFDHGINSAIRQLRAALGDTAQECRYIETERGRGYRLIAPVQALPLAAPVATVSDAPLPPVPRHSRRRVAVAALAASVLAVLLLASSHSRPRAREPRVRRVVLELSAIDARGKPGAVPPLLERELVRWIGALRPPDVEVVPATAVANDADTRLEVSFFEGSPAHFFARLVDVRTGAHQWGGAIASATEARSRDRAVRRVATLATAELGRRSGPEPSLCGEPAIATSIAALRELAARVPDCTEARALLAELLAKSGADGANGKPRVREAIAYANHVLAREPRSADALTALGIVKLYVERDAISGEHFFRRAIEAEPGDAEARMFLAIALSARGLHAAALDEADRARRLDPLLFGLDSTRARLLFFAGHYEEALDEYRTLPALRGDDLEIVRAASNVSGIPADRGVDVSPASGTPRAETPERSSPQPSIADLAGSPSPGPQSAADSIAW